MTFNFAFWQQLRFSALLLSLLALLGIKRCADQLSPAALPAATCAVAAPPARAVSYSDTSTACPCLDRKAAPRSRWHALPGPAYLVYPLPRRPSQAQLDAEAAHAAQLRKI